jgi:diguanylate cyclase (GGDEF)-like protein
MAETHRRRHRQPLDSLATKIILFVFVSTFATALLVSWISIQSTYVYLSEMVDRQYPISLARARSQLQTWIGAGSLELWDLAGAGDTRSTKRLERALAASNRFDALLLVSRKGKLRRSAIRHGSDLPDAAKLPLSADVLGLHSLPVAGGRRTAAFGVRRNPDAADSDRLIGVFRREEIEGLVGDLQTGPGEVFLLADGAGQVLFGRGEETGTIPLADTGPGVREYQNATGAHVIGSAVPLGLSDWNVAVEAPFDVVFAPVVSVVKRIFVIDLCIILLFSVLAYKITAAIVRPIETLSDGARRIAQGQLDLEISEPSTRDEIGLLTRSFNDMMRKLRGNQAEIEAVNAKLVDRNLELQQANEVLEQLSITDGLTKLHNHRFFQDHLTREIKRVNRIRKPLSMILVDVDDFKSLNDRMGHAAGDELLRNIALLMNDTIRESDLLARYGGDEFVVLASNTDLAGAQQLAEKICTAIAEASFIIDESLRPTRATTSMGVAQYEGTRKQFFTKADRALYRAKAQGKNCVMADGQGEVL